MIERVAVRLTDDAKRDLQTVAEAVQKGKADESGGWAPVSVSDVVRMSLRWTAEAVRRGRLRPEGRT